MRRLRERFRAPAAALAGVARSRDLRRIQLAYLGSEVGSWIAMIALSVLSFTEGGLTGVGGVRGLRDARGREGVGSGGPESIGAGRGGRGEPE